jgi:SAM-dependent methyltransferase
VDNTKRFSDRVDNYKKYRPDYPAEVVDVLKSRCDLNKSSVIADVGSGTGIFSALLLPHVGSVYAVEPNAEMRKIAEETLSSYTGFVSKAASAEATGLATHSVDMVTAATAFHWFDKQKVKKEFYRILKNDKWVALIWNEKNTGSTGFMAGYDALFKQYAPQYAEREHKNLEALLIEDWYGQGHAELITFRNHQIFNWERLQGRSLSSSYAPQKGHPNHEAMMAGLKQLYEHHAQDDAIIFEYITKLYIGTMKESR